MTSSADTLSAKAWPSVDQFAAELRSFDSSLEFQSLLDDLEFFDLRQLHALGVAEALEPLQDFLGVSRKAYKTPVILHDQSFVSLIQITKSIMPFEAATHWVGLDQCSPRWHARVLKNLLPSAAMPSHQKLLDHEGLKVVWIDAYSKSAPLFGEMMRQYLSQKRLPDFAPQMVTALMELVSNAFHHGGHQKSVCIHHGIIDDLFHLEVIDYFGKLSFQKLIAALSQASSGGQARVNLDHGGAGIGLYMALEFAQSISIKVIDGVSCSIQLLVDLTMSPKQCASMPKSFLYQSAQEAMRS